VKVKNLQHGQAVRLVTVPFDRQMCHLNSKTRFLSNSTAEQLLADAVVIARDRAMYVLILAYLPSVLAILNNFTVFVTEFVTNVSLETS